jgi:hypothetical protein
VAALLGFGVIGQPYDPDYVCLSAPAGFLYYICSRAPARFLSLNIVWAPAFFLAALLVGWPASRFLRKYGRFTLWWTVGLAALCGGFITLVFWPFFLLVFWLVFWFSVTPPRDGALVYTMLILAGVIGGGAAGATFWALARDSGGASAASSQL